MHETGDVYATFNHQCILKDLLQTQSEIANQSVKGLQLYIYYKPATKVEKIYIYRSRFFFFSVCVFTDKRGRVKYTLLHSVSGILTKKHKHA